MKDKENEIPEIVKEVAFMFDFCSVMECNPEMFLDLSKPMINDTYKFLHNEIFYSKKKHYNLYNEKDLKKIRDRLFTESMSFFNNDYSYPYRLFINGCFLVTIKEKVRTIFCKDPELSSRLVESKIIENIMHGLLARDKKLYQRALENSEFLIFDLNIFTKFAPMAIINPDGTPHPFFWDDGGYDEDYGDDEDE